MTLITHLELLSLTLFLSILTYHSFLYNTILKINLNIASNPTIKEKLNGPLQRKTIIKANEEYTYWQYFIFPGIVISLLTTLTIWYYSSHNYILSTLVIWSSVIVLSTSITSFIRNETYPDWLLDWSILLNNTQFQIQLDTIQQQLIQTKQQLINAVNNNHSNIDINRLKYECLTLSKEAFILTNKPDEVQKINKLLNIKEP